MSRCDDYCCNHGCTQGRNCPARRTMTASMLSPGELRAQRMQADTDRQQAQRGELPSPTKPLTDPYGPNDINDPSEPANPNGGTVGLALVAVAAVWLVAVVIAPFLAGWWHA